MSAIQLSEDSASLDTVHLPIIDKAKFKGTPAYEFALKRLLSLGLTLEEAKELLKD